MMKVLLSFFLISLFLVGCKQQGCMDEKAENFDSAATKEDHSCTYLLGCMDPEALNYDIDATQSNYSCEYLGSAFIYTTADDSPDCGNIRIVFAQTDYGYITRHTPKDSLECGHPSGITIEMEAGTYEYIAYGGWGCKWYGTVTLSSRGCTFERILP